MPTPDASQFIQQKRFSARPPTQNSRLTQFVPPVSSLNNFLPSLMHSGSQPKRYIPMNIPTGVQAKPKVPQGNVF